MQMVDPRKVPFDFLMKMIGECGRHVMVRFDPLRDKDKFTVIVDNNRLGDTDRPRNLLVDYYDKYDTP